MGWREREIEDDEIPWWEQPDVPVDPGDTSDGSGSGSGHVWTDPDNDPNPRIYDPSAPPDGDPGPGNYWAWDGSMWVIRRSPQATTHNTNTTPGQNIDTTPTTNGPYPPSFNLGGFRWPSFLPPSFVDPGAFDPGAPFSYAEFQGPEFVAPTGQDVLSDPSFQFRMDEGRKALEASAAGKGILRSGGSMKDLLKFGQSFASQEFDNVFNRALNTHRTRYSDALNEYDTNRRTAYDTWNTGYMGRKDAYGFSADRANSLNAFNMNNSQFDFNSRQRQAEMEFRDLYERWAKEGDWLRDIGVAGLD